MNRSPWDALVLLAIILAGAILWLTLSSVARGLLP